MKKILLTGFEPFLNFKLNPTMEVVKHLDGSTINGYEVVTRVLPVDFSTSGKELLNAIEETKPDAIVSLGLAGGRSKVTPERIAINCNDGGEPDNNGRIPSGEPIVEAGSDGLFSTLPIREMVKELKEKGYPAEISNSAGTYLCNHVMYQALNYVKQQDQQIPTGFIHIPASHELAIEHGKVPSWSQTDLNEAVSVCLACIKDGR
ncbi:pyroglutamyl-peptidase I [Alkalibacillus haloalkaliphilus]|uniref:pyroglutamyl-peptidase I n=1 Tax=Alkalibacillus haloalkaliphilus TaxID=94136 RepID=UPI002935F214|nr:pyroglutamyl-peptidase I [Alkalibacillus haloalkaliphilus]MDV2583006.1 pyroglutamyl-peptidase I [Alkalibacillus haloalkaliphilus]